MSTTTSKIYDDLKIRDENVPVARDNEHQTANYDERQVYCTSKTFDGYFEARKTCRTPANVDESARL